MIDISVIIVNWNTVDLLRQCLTSIFKCTNTSTSFEVIVVDNASGDGSADMVEQEFHQVVLIKNTQNVGFAKANNQAAHIAHGSFLLLLNSDTVLFSDLLTNLLTAARNQPKTVGIIGPR